MKKSEKTQNMLRNEHYCINKAIESKINELDTIMGGGLTNKVISAIDFSANETGLSHYHVTDWVIDFYLTYGELPRKIKHLCNQNKIDLGDK